MSKFTIIFTFIWIINVSMSGCYRAFAVSLANIIISHINSINKKNKIRYTILLS